VSGALERTFLKESERLDRAEVDYSRDEGGTLQPNEKVRGRRERPERGKKDNTSLGS